MNKQESLIAFICDEGIIPYENIKYVDLDAKKHQDDHISYRSINIVMGKDENVLMYRDRNCIDFTLGYTKYLSIVEKMTIGAIDE